MAFMMISTAAAALNFNEAQIQQAAYSYKRRYGECPWYKVVRHIARIDVDQMMVKTYAYEKMLERAQELYYKLDNLDGLRKDTKHWVETNLFRVRQRRIIVVERDRLLKEFLQYAEDKLS